MHIDDASLQERLDVLRGKHGVPGASVALLADGTVTAAASGVLNLDTGVAATTESLFQIGSITKVWTATVVMQLIDEGSVELDAPVVTYLPEFAVADVDVGRAVTIRNLLAHTSGIDGDHLPDLGRGDDVLARYVASCSPLKQVHPLSATMSYCNTGFGLLGRVIEVVTGSVWDAALQARLIGPLGLTHTVTLPEDALRFSAAIGHIQPPGHELRPAPTWGLPRSAGPAGLVCATASDVVEFARLHLQDGHTRDGARILSEDSARAMRSPQIDVPSGLGLFPQQWGLGWGVYTWDGHAVVGHDGGTIGQSAFLRVVPEAGIAVALLTNGGNMIALFQDLCGDLLADTAGVHMPALTTPAASPSPYDPEPYVGTYEREGARIEVLARDGGIVGVQTVTGPAAAMTPEPFELPFVAFAVDDDLFLTCHPAAPDLWLPSRFLTLSDGSRCLHIGGRATPRTR